MIDLKPLLKKLKKGAMPQKPSRIQANIQNLRFKKIFFCKNFLYCIDYKLNLR